MTFTCMTRAKRGNKDGVDHRPRVAARGLAVRSGARRATSPVSVLPGSVPASLGVRALLNRQAIVLPARRFPDRRAGDRIGQL